MLDIKWIRENPDAFDAALRSRGIELGQGIMFSAQLIEMDEIRRRHLASLQEFQARRNAASKEIGKAKASKDEVSVTKLMAEVAELKEAIRRGEDEERRLNLAVDDALDVIPNVPRSEVPVGSDEKGNVEVRRMGSPPEFDFAPKQHFEIGEALDLMDFETAVKLSGARFVVLKGALSRLERALAAFMLEVHTAVPSNGVGGYTEINPPLIVLDDTMYGTAQLPKFRSDQYQATREIGELPFEKCTITDRGFEIVGELTREEKEIVDEAMRLGALPRPAQQRGLSGWGPVRWRFESHGWLIPTAEVPLTNLVKDSILEEKALPLRFTGYTPCFRAEAGAAGRDTRGMIRQHQFSKVELVSVTTPEASLAEHERMTACAEEILKRLGLPYRTMLLCTGDMGFASQKTYDIEVWLPGQDAYREISSCSVCGDFQARRMGARYRPKGAKDLRYVHTLNGSGLAVGRTLVAVLENYQQADGSVIIPEVLQPYMGGMAKIEKAS